MSDIETDSVTSAMSPKERELNDRLGSRLLLIWLLSGIALTELLVIVHLARA